MKRLTVILLAAFGYLALVSGVYAQGTVADDSGTPLGTFEVHPFPAGGAFGFPFSMEVTRSNGDRWVLTPLGVNGPTDRTGGGPLLWSLREYVPKDASIDRNHPNREGQMITDPHPSFKDHVRVQLAFKPVPEPPGASWIYSARFEILHFVGKETMSRAVSWAGKYTMDGSTSLEILDDHNVISGSILIGGRRRAIHGRAYGSLVLAIIDGTTGPNAVRTHLELRFDPDARKVTGKYNETGEGGRIISGSEKTFIATP
jgi:hypothetical protein